MSSRAWPIFRSIESPNSRPTLVPPESNRPKLAGAVKPVFVRRLRFNVATLDAFLTNLKQSQEQWLEKVGSQSDKMTSVPPDYAMIPVLANYPSAEAEAVARKSGSGDRNPYCIDITDGARLADFKKTRTIMVEILAPKDGEQSSLFAGLSNVRILEVRVWLMGLVLPERGAQISINIYRDCASGDTILPRNGTEQIFFHDPISGPFQYSLPTPTEPYIGHAFSLVGGARAKILPISIPCSRRADLSAFGGLQLAT